MRRAGAVIEIREWEWLERSITVDAGSHYPHEVPRVSLAHDFDQRAEPERACVLAVRRLRRGLERRSTARTVVGSPSMAMNTGELARELEDLIAALDRRVPRVEQAGEVTIAREAAALRARAVNRLAELAAIEVAPAVRRRGDQP